jgi:PAS domain S-box-containing protein
MWEKVLLNLLSNAFKFTLQGRITVVVRDLPSGVEVAVTDTGTGIPIEDQPRLFERFYRVQGAEGRSFEGTGIGLALVHELVRLHGGTINLKSEVGHGSTFIIHLLRGRGHLPPDQVRHGISPPIWKTEAPFVIEAERWLSNQAYEDILKHNVVSDGVEKEKTRVLLADDNADMLAYIRSLLVPHYEVDAVRDGLEALAAIEAHRPDLVLTDVMMPHLDGFGLLQEIRKKPSLQTLPVILLSARAGEEAKVEGLNAGADDYLIKPFNARELLARVRVHLTLAQVRQRATEQVTHAQDRLQHLLKLLPAGVYACDETGRISFFNQRAVQLWGQEPGVNDEGRFCGFHRVIQEDGSLATPAQSVVAQAVFAGKSYRNLETEVIRKDGQHLFISISIDPLKDEAGKIIGAVNIFQDITESKATAVALKNELDERRRVAHHASFLSSLSQRLSLLNDPEEILRVACEMVGAHLEVERCSFIEVDDGAKTLLIQQDWVRTGLDHLANQYYFRDFGTSELWANLSSHGVAVENVSQHPFTRGLLKNFDAVNVRAFVIVPFSQGGRLRTLLSVSCDKPRNWRRDEHALLENVVNRVQPLVEQARSRADLQVRNERMQLLSETLSQLLSARDPNSVVKDLFVKVASHLRADTYFNFMVNDAGTALRLHSYEGISEEVAANIQNLEFGQSICGTVAETCQPITASDIQNTTYDKANLVRGFGIQTYACNPLMAGGRLLGTLSFASRTRPSFDEDELKFIRVVTHSVALVLEQLKLSKDRLHLATIVTSSDDAILSKDLNGCITSWNQGAQRIFGYEAAEVIGKPITILIPEDRQAEEPVILEKIRAGNSIDHFETIRQRKDGSLVDISLTISPIRDEKGVIVGISKIGHDITDRKKNERELVRREQLYRSIGESINYGIWVCDADGRIIYVSDSFLNLIGKSLEEFASNGWIGIVHPEEVGKMLEDWEIACRTASLWEREIRIKGKDGQWHPILTRGTPIRDDQGDIVSWAGIHLDTSTFKRTEEALRQQSEILALLNQASSTLVAERDLEKIVQSVTDISREICDAEFGVFFYNTTNDNGELFTLCTLSGVPKEEFAKFPSSLSNDMLREVGQNTDVLCIDDVSQTSNIVLKLLADSSLKLRSGLRVPVISNSGQIIGVMFFGHSQPSRFQKAVGDVLLGMAAQAAIAVDNAGLYASLQRELDQVKRVESALRASELRWRELANAMPHLVWTCGPDGAWDYISPQWCEYTGSREEEQRGFGWASAIFPEDLPKFETAWNLAAHSRDALDVEVRIRRADGEYRWFKTRAVPVKDAENVIIKWYGSNTDIEDIKRRDGILREREAHLSAIFAQAGSGIVQTDTKGHIVMVNDAYCEIVARTRDELLGRSVHDLTHPDDKAENLIVFEAMMKGESSFIIEKRDLLPDDNAVWVRNSVVGIRDEKGHVIAGLIVTQDITDSREAEDALRASEEQLRLVTDHAPVLLAQIDRHHTYKFVNRPYAQRYGFEPSAVIGKHVRDVASESAYQSALALIERAFTGEQVEFEQAIPYEILGTRWAHVIFVPERNNEGDVVGIVVMLTDITMRKQAENELEKARDSALEAVRAKDDFLARLSHELRTPLSPVLLLASEGSANLELPEEVRSEFEIIRKNVDLEARLIDDLLDITRITRGKLALELKPLNVAEIIKDAVGTIRGEAIAKKVNLSVNPGAEDLRVTGDAVRLQQVLWNLLNNAVKFTPAQGNISVTTEVENDGETIVIRVTDTGIGMRPEEIKHIFDAFAQGDHAEKTSSQHFGGLGLGLAISRMLMELHHGEIFASSAGRGEGSTFIIKLPLLTTSEEVSSTEGDSVKKVPESSEKVQIKLNILLVEDHEPSRLALSSLLRRRGHQVTIAASLAEARQQVKLDTFDLLISDLGLPDGTGYELMEEIGGLFKYKGLAVSGFGMEQDISRSRAAGFVSHLIKPVRIEAIESAISAACSDSE